MARRSNEYLSFLRRLRRLRLDAALSQSEVARRLEKPQSYVSKCESGERRVDVVELLAFARVYGVPLQAFVEERAYSAGATPLRRVAEKARAAPPRRRR